MLSTLNLQFSSLETLDPGLASPALAPPDSGTGVASGFADLLRLKVDSALAEARTSGQLLPQAGSELPVTPERVAVELIEGVGRELADGALRTPAIDQQLLAETRALADGADPQIELAVPVRYPVVDAVAPSTTEIAGITQPAAPAVSSAGLDSPQPAAPPVLNRLPAADGAPRAPQPAATLMSRDALPPRLPDVPANVTGTIEARPPELGQQHRVQLATPQSVTIEPAAMGHEQRPVVDLSRRPETIPFQGPVGSTEEISDVFKARPTVLQTVQVLNAQANSQQPQPAFSAAPAATPAAESSYSAAVQQASDLISTSVRDAGWGDRLGDRVLLMAGNQVRTAEIRLTPAELGPLRVQVALDDGAAHVTFQAQHAVTRLSLIHI